jgi:sugar/nucleoside kinase (ribokinase family)
VANRDIDVIAAGHVCLDIIPGFDHERRYTIEDVFSPGKIVDVRAVAISTGGPVSNTGIGLVKLGNKVTFIARIGDDEFGRLTLEGLKQWADVEGISISEGEHSSYTVALAPPGIDRIFFHYPGTNHTFSADDVNPDLCARARLFHLGYPPLMRTLYENDGEQLAEVFRRAKDKGVTTSLDMALPDPRSEAGQLNWQVILKKLLPYVDIFHPSAEEGLFMAQRDKWEQLRSKGGDLLDHLSGPDYSELSSLLLSWGSSLVTLKSGHRGFYLRTGDKSAVESIGSASPSDSGTWANRELWSPAYVVDPIASATGSGDSSLAGFTTAYLRGETPERCVAAGNALGYQNLQALDAVTGIQDWETTEKIMADSTLPRHSIPHSEGWTFDKEPVLGHGPNDQPATE